MKINKYIWILLLLFGCISAEFIGEPDFSEDTFYDYSKKSPTEVEVFVSRPPYIVEYTGTLYLRNYNGKEDLATIKKYVQE